MQPLPTVVIHKNFVAGFDTPRNPCASASAADSDIPPAIPRAAQQRVRSAAGKFIPLMNDTSCRGRCPQRPDAV